MTKIARDLTFQTPEELEHLQQEHQIPSYITKSIMDKSETAHIRADKDKYYMVLNFPLMKTFFATNHKYLKPIAICISEHDIYFLHQSDIILTDFLANNHTESPMEILLNFIIYTLKQYEIQVNEMNNLLNPLEHDVIHHPNNTQIQQLFLLQKQVIQYQTAIIGINHMIQLATTNHLKSLSIEDHFDRYADIQIECTQIESMITILNNTIESLVNVSGSILSNNLSQTMKKLTSITIVISIPTLITGFYGMNIDLPFQEHPYSLLIVSLGSLFITILAVLYLYKKDLF